MTVTTKCPKCGHIIEITDQIHSDVQLICDSLAAEADQLKSEIAPLRIIRDAMPAQEDVRLALLAVNNGSECDFRVDLCRCDHDTGLVPCAYCAIYTVLQRALRVVRFRDADEQSIDNGLAAEVKQLKTSLVKGE